MESHFHLYNDCAHSGFGREGGGRNCFNLAAVKPLGFFLSLEIPESVAKQI